MQRRPRRWMEAYTRRHSLRQIWKKFVQTLACIVVFCTTYALILPAITMEQQYSCGLEEHTHTDSCYSQLPLMEINCSLESLQVHSHTEQCLDPEGNTLCGISDQLLHSHEKLCYDSSGQLVCPLEEIPAHTHGETCWEGENLICSLPQLCEHTHTDACRDENGALSCTLPELKSHQHSQGCILEVSQQKMLTCTLQEHTHTESCTADPEADVETAEQWEASFAHVQLTDSWTANLLAVARTQLGYEESSRNYISDDGVTRQGYTRYGAWYGSPYGDWCAMFTSFCLHYAEVEGIPLHWGVRPWIEELTELKLYQAKSLRSATVQTAVL